jgi:hypothetical protein
MNKKYAIGLILGCTAFWTITEWQSVYMLNALATALGVGAMLTWAVLAFLAQKPDWFESEVHQQVSSLARKTSQLMSAAAIVGIVVTAELLSSWVLMPQQQQTALLERVTCSMAGAGKLSGLRFGQDTDGQDMCFRWDTGSIDAIERLNPDEWPGMKSVAIGGKISVTIERQTSWLLGPDAWYRVVQ